MNRLLEVARLFVGGVFLVTGILKLPDLEEVSAFIAGVGVLPSGWADLLATILVGLEIVAGLGLVIGWKVRLWSRVVGVLLVIFLAAPLALPASLAGRPCPCFGIPLPGMPQILRYLMDLLLLNASLMMIVTGYRGDRSMDAVGSLSVLQRITLIAACTASVAYLFFYGSMVYGETGSLLPGNRNARITEFLEKKNIRRQGSATSGRIVLFLDVEAFGCPMCVEDLQAMCDSLNKIFAQYPEAQVVAILRDSRQRSPERLELMADTWAQSNHIRFPVLGDSERASTGVGAPGMSIMLQDQYDNVLLMEDFPLGAGKRSEVLRMFLEMQRGGGEKWWN